MAHPCPDCALVCHCNGDIDDLVFEGTVAQLRCRHCEDDSADDEYDLEDW